MVQICNGIDASFTVDVRELILQRESIPAAHENPEYRPSIDELVELYRINEEEAEPPPSALGVVDDVLTAGTHFKAMKHVLETRFSDVSIFGLFIARRVFPDDETSDLQKM